MNIFEKTGLGRRLPTDLELAGQAEVSGDPDFAQWLRDRHAKKTTKSEALPEANRSNMSKWEARLVFGGISTAMGVGVHINPETIKALHEAEDVLGREYLTS
ncbi:MAG TPA: hypothetical protein VFW90_03265 [Candidatus Saccharimonadales bacterium]|nr:hypothetical protein [Candidatus Saccharimonadales bacterium]